MKSHFNFNRGQRSGILFLCALVLSLLAVYIFVDFEEKPVLNTSSAEVLAMQAQLDSLRSAEIEARKPKIYPFNPNFLTDYRAYTLGMTTEEFDKLQAFRKNDQWINSTADFQKVTGVNDSLLNEISPYFKFPEWVTNPSPKRDSFKKFDKKLSYSEKTDLNLATKEQLMKVSGIGDYYSDKILALRNDLGGFSNDVQLNSVYGLDAAVIARVLNQFTVKTPKKVQMMNVNKASASDIATIPGISFQQAKEIWEFVRLREGISALSELENLPGISSRQLQLIHLYLSVE